MRRYVGLLIGIVLSLSLRGQDIPVPKDVIDRVVDELIIKDGMEATINLQERTIALYRRNEFDYLERINTYYLTIEEYKVIIKAMEEKQLLTEQQVKDCNHQNRIERRRAFWNGVKTGSGGTLLLILGIIILL